MLILPKLLLESPNLSLSQEDEAAAEASLPGPLDGDAHRECHEVPRPVQQAELWIVRDWTRSQGCRLCLQSSLSPVVFVSSHRSSASILL